MRRAIFLFSVLVAFPHFGGAQSQPSARMHTVAPGETLGGIAQRYLGSAADWRRIYEANREQISNPDMISPGMQLAIPGSGSTGVANVLGFETGGAAAAVADLGSYTARRESLRYGTFGTSEMDVYPEDARTVFYEAGSVITGQTVVISPREETPALQEASFHAASWLIPEHDGSDRRGEVVGVVRGGNRPDGSTVLFPADEVQLRMDDGILPAVGTELISYSVPRVIPELGAVAVPTGRLRVTGAAGNVATAAIVATYETMRIGNLVAELEAFPLVAGVHPSPVTEGGEARIVAFEAVQEIYLPGDVAFLDRGSDAGVAIGDELVAVLPGVASPDAGIARFQVVRVRPAGATVRLTSVESNLPLRPGLLLTTDRKMP